MSDAAPDKPPKKIYRSRNDRLLGGILAGIAESQGWDITFTRMVYIILPCVGSMIGWKIGAGFLALYLLAWFVLPDGEYTLDDDARGSNHAEKENKQ